MLRFKIQSVMGSSAKSESREDFFGIRRSFFVAAANRVDAFVQIFSWLTQQGHDVTVLQISGHVNPLNFSSKELADVRAAGISIQTGYPTSGFQIEEIVPA